MSSSTHVLELGIGRKKTRIIKRLSKTFLLTYLCLFVVCYLQFEWHAIVNCCFVVIGNCPYSERFCTNFPFGTSEQDPMTY